MKPNIDRTTVNLSEYPDLVVIYLGMRAQSLRGVGTLLKIGPQINQAVAEKPDGLLLHENLIFSLLPLHFGMRQYWRDFDSLETWTRTLPHKKWWQDFLQDDGGTSFWHETYFMRGGMEAIYLNAENAVGLGRFAPAQSAQGSMFSARRRLKLETEANEAQPLSDQI